MSVSEFVWGIILVAAGVFVGVYGNQLFRFALAVMGFGLGFLGAIWVTDGQDTSLRVLVGLAAGGLVAALFYALVRFTLYIAGGLFGLVVALCLLGLISLFGPNLNEFLQSIIGLGGIGLGGFFGPRLGNLIILLASSGAGAYLVVQGLRVLYESRLGGDLSDPSATLSQRLTITIFAIIFAISFLGQYNYRRFRQRVLS